MNTQVIQCGVLAAALALAACAGHLASAPAAARSGYAQVRGIQIYYERHGKSTGDPPLVLLPGGGSTIEATYGRIMPFLAQHREVIAIEEQNHGRSGHRSIPERFSDSAEDVAAVLAALELSKVDLMGFSNGGSIALQVALRHRDLIRKLVFAGSMTKKSGAAPQFWERMRHSSFDDMPEPLKHAFLKVNPDQAQLHDMYEKDAERMHNFVETSDEEVKSLDIPILILIGDHDVATTEHALELSHLIRQSQLIILPGSHGEYLDEARSRYPEITSLLIDRFLTSVTSPGKD